MRRDKFTETWRTGLRAGSMMARSFEDNAGLDEHHTQESMPEPAQSELPAATISHSRARELIQEQTRRLLPPQEANALADHLLVCDRCFRYAQDIAHQERQSGKHSAVHREESRPG